MDALKREKIDTVFFCNDISQIINKVYGISCRQFFNMNKTYSNCKLRKKIHIS